MKLFEVPKVGLHLDNITHGTEVRDGEEVKIVTLTLRASPLTAQLASAMPGPVRMLLFKSTEGATPRPHLRRAEFDLGVPRQSLEVYASSDTADPSISIDQAKVAAVLARIDKDVQGWALVVKVSFGPLDKSELAYIEDWRLGQRWVTWLPAEPGFFDEDAPAADAEPAAQLLN
jgi:hypothetical protein